MSGVVAAESGGVQSEFDVPRKLAPFPPARPLPLSVLSSLLFATSKREGSKKKEVQDPGGDRTRNLRLPGGSELEGRRVNHFATGPRQEVLTILAVLDPGNSWGSETRRWEDRIPTPGRRRTQQTP